MADLRNSIKEINIEFGGFSKSAGKIAEDFFYTALSSSFRVGTLKFDYVDRNLTRKKDYVEGEYDIVLYNSNKILIVEVKHIFRKKYLLKFYKSELKNFKILYPDFKNYKIYGAVAAMSFEEGVLEEARKFGFYVLTQNNQNVAVLNDPTLEPKQKK